MAHDVSGANAPVKFGLVDCTNAEYHGGPGVSKSHLDVIARSPLHYWQGYVNPERAPREATPAMVVGTAIHSAILEPDLFTSQYVVAPDINRRTNAGKAEWAAFVDEHEGYAVLTQEQYDTALGARDSVRRHPLVRDMLSRGKAEQSYYAMDSDTGLVRKCRFDWLDYERGFALDVKSTVDASAEFMRSCLKYRYHVQQAWYVDTLTLAVDFEQTVRDWVFLAVEKDPPYACALYRLPSEMIRAGRRAAVRDLALIAQCRSSDEWPGYPTDVSELALSGWQRKALGADSAESDFEGLE